MMKCPFLTIKAANIFLAGSVILLLGSCLLAPAPTNAPITESSSYAELTSAFTAAPGSSATQTFPSATSDNIPTSDQGWSNHVYGGTLRGENTDIAFRYPEYWKLFYIYEYDELPDLDLWASAWLNEVYICMIELDKDVGMFFHYKLDEDNPLHLFTRWAKHGMDINKVVISMPETVADSDGWNIATPSYPFSLIDETIGGQYISRVVNFKPETVADGGNIMIAGREASILTAHGNGLTVQATYFKDNCCGQVMGMIWYAPSDQWDAMEEIFSEILASITFLCPYGIRSGIKQISFQMPDDWSEGTWFQSADHKIGMLIEMMPQADPSTLLAHWSTLKLSSLGFSNCSVPIPGEQMKAGHITADSMQGNCLDDSGMEVTYTVAYKRFGNDTLEVVTYFPTLQSEQAWILSYMFESIHLVNICELDPFHPGPPECSPE